MTRPAPLPGMVEDYEALRGAVLSGQPGGPQFGRVVVERAGLAAWAEAWSAATPAPRREAPKPTCPLPVAVDETVRLLAGMAMAVAGAAR